MNTSPPDDTIEREARSVVERSNPRWQKHGVDASYLISSGGRVPCLIAVLALAMPRLVIALLWLFTTWFRGMFDTMLWPILGIIFLPTTLLWYSAVQHWFGGQWTLWPIVGLVVALLIDISPAGSKRASSSK